MIIAAKSKNMTLTCETVSIGDKRKRYWTREAKARFRASIMRAQPLCIPLPLKLPTIKIQSIGLFSCDDRPSKFKIKTTNRRPILDMVEDTDTIVKEHHANSTMDSTDKKINRIPNPMLDLTVNS